MKLIVGLGNPGKEYEQTRHNIGFMTLDNYLNNISFKAKDNYMYCELFINNEKIIFMKPMTFMNDSGLAVRKVIDYYKINLEDVLIIYDEMDLDVGKYKLKIGGSSAGHNGIKSIIKSLGTEKFKRFRIGISKPSNSNTIDFVLGKFSKDEKEIINNVLKISKEIISDYPKFDFMKLMNKYN